MAAIAGLRAGRVRLVSFPTASSTLVPPAVARLRDAHPGVRVSLVEAEPPESLAMLRGGECDIALAFRYPGEHLVSTPAHGVSRSARAAAVLAAAETAAAGDWSELVVRPLLDDPLVGLLPVGHPLAERAAEHPVRLAELAEEQWIAGCPQCRGQLVELCAEAASRPGSTSPPTTTRRWSAWWPRVSGSPCCRAWRWTRCGTTRWRRCRCTRRTAGPRCVRWWR